MNTKWGNIVLTVLLFGLFFYFIYSGYAVINSSHSVYDKTVQVAEVAKAPDKICTTCIKEGYAQALLYFSIALGTIFLLFLLPRLQSICFGGFSISLRELQSDLENLKSQTNDIQENLVDSGGGKALPEEQLREMKQKISRSKREAAKTDMDPEDPQKGKWGGFPESNGRKLSASVTLSGVKGFYQVRLWVESTQSNNSLKGLVTFHLHPTFRNQDPIIAVKNGIAELRLNLVYGAFTVGAEADDGNTKLELDLSSLPGLPEDFKNN